MFNGLHWLIVSLAILIPAQPQYVVEIGNVQLAQSLPAVVRDPAGEPLPGVLVEEFNSDWKESLRSTTTDVAGVFKFAPSKGRNVYHFQLRLNGFNPLRVRVRVDPKRGKELQLQLELAT